jgi:hypothetical protein
MGEAPMRARTFRTLLLAAPVLVGSSCEYSSEFLAGDTGLDDAPAWDTPLDEHLDAIHDSLGPEAPFTDATDPYADPEPDAPTWPCVPELAAQPRLILGGTTTSVGSLEDPDRPVLFTNDLAQVWLVSRVVSFPSCSDCPKLVYVTVNPRNGLPGGPMFYPIMGGSLNAFHPSVAVGDRMLTAIRDPYGYMGNGITYIVLMNPPLLPRPPTPAAIEGTDVLSTQPDVATNGSESAVVWSQVRPPETASGIEVGFISHEGEPIGTGAWTPAELGPAHDPLIVYNGVGYGILNIVEFDTGISTLEIRTLASAVGPEDYPPWLLPHISNVSGRPAFAWDGSGYGILVQEEESALEFNRLDADLGGGSGRSLDTDLKPFTGEFVRDHPGMIDMVWTGERYGVVFVFLDTFGATRVWFFEMSRDGDILNGPYLLNEEADESFHPTITWVQTDTMWYYVFAWVEYMSVSDTDVLYTYSYGCSL